MGQANYARSERNRVLQSYLSEIRDYPLLTREEERKLATGIRNGSQKDRNSLVEANLPFVIKIATEYRNRGLSFEDLINEGNIGLLEAARKYDPERRIKFITYAVWWIRKSILKALSELDPIGVPMYKLKSKREIADAEYNLRQKLGRDPTTEEVAEESGKSEASIRRTMMELLANSTSSLDDPVGDGSDTFADMMPDYGCLDPEEDLLEKERRMLVREAIGGLGHQERVVIIGRYFKEKTLEGTGEELNLTRERIRQIELKAKNRLRMRISKKYPRIVK